MVDPFAFERFRKEKIRQEIESERKPRLQLNSKLPKVNQELALKIIDEQTNPSAKQAAKQIPSLLEDNRFKAMFENTDYNIDKNADEYKMLAPVLNRLEKSKLKEIKKRVEVARVNELHEEESRPHEDSDNDEDLFGLEKSDDERPSSGAESSDDEGVREFNKEMKKAYKDVKKQRTEEFEALNEQEPEEKEITNNKPAKTANKKDFKLMALQSTAEMSAVKRGMMKVTLQDRVAKAEESNAKIQTIGRSLGNRQMTFDMRKPPSKEMRKREYQMKQHREERKKLIRPIKSLKLKKVNFK